VVTMFAPVLDWPDHGLAVTAAERLFRAAAIRAFGSNARAVIEMTVCPGQSVALQRLGSPHHTNACGDGTDMEVVLWVGIHTRASFCNMKHLSVLVPDYGAGITVEKQRATGSSIRWLLVRRNRCGDAGCVESW
jgi:hypothetical protein